MRAKVKPTQRSLFDPTLQSKDKCDEKTNQETTAVKHDSDKSRMDLIPPELMFAVGDILSFGADKYSHRNWEKGMDWGRVYGALQRHLWAWWNREDKDDETGKSHLHHAACCISFLIAYEEREIGRDDRAQKVQLSEHSE